MHRRSTVGPAGGFIEVRCAAADDVPLSTAKDRESCYIAVHRYHRTTTELSRWWSRYSLPRQDALTGVSCTPWTMMVRPQCTRT